MTADRYWILNPAGHRQAATPATEADLEGTPWEGAAVIDLSAAMGDTWVCDLCNEEILTVWGDEPWPVPVLGSDALCADHYYQAQGWYHQDPYGEPTARQLGVWPAQVCTCTACTDQLELWYPMLRRAWLDTDRVLRPQYSPF